MYFGMELRRGRIISANQQLEESLGDKTIKFAPQEDPTLAMVNILAFCLTNTGSIPNAGQSETSNPYMTKVERTDKKFRGCHGDCGPTSLGAMTATCVLMGATMSMRRG